MTTIATDGQTMAGDGQATLDRGIITTLSRVKVRRLPDGSLAGCAGDAHDGQAMIEWLAQGGKFPKLKDVTALRLMPCGEVRRYTDASERFSVIDAPAAIGSGEELALGAMLAGAEPRKAVEIAASRDPGTGGEIVELGL